MSERSGERLKRAMQNLKADTAFKDRYANAATLEDRMARTHTPAVGIAVIDDFKLAGVEAFGVHEAGVSDIAGKNSLFLAGSISKPVFATAIMLLVQQGVIDLDEDINEYLKSWKIPANNGWQPRITLRHILSHTAGLTVHGFRGYLISEAIPTLPQILNGEQPANSPKVEVNIMPGVQFRYSGGGTTVAQLAITEHLNESFPDVMKRLVFEPLGMNNSTFENPLPADLHAMAAVAHPWKSVALKGKYPVYPEMAAAGLWTTAEDLAKFGIALQKSLSGTDASYLDKSTLETMLSPQLAKDKEASDYDGLGFFCSGEGDAAVFEHGGWDEGFIADLTLYRSSGKGAVVMINSNEGAPLVGEIVKAIAEEYDWPDSSKKKCAVKLSDLDIYAGNYESEQSLRINLEVTKGGLLLNYERQPSIFFEASSETSFFSGSLNTELNFKMNDDGAVTALSLQQAGTQIEAQKS